MAINTKDWMRFPSGMGHTGWSFRADQWLQSLRADVNTVDGLVRANLTELNSYNDDWTDYSVVATIAGFTTNVANTVYRYQQVGSVVHTFGNCTATGAGTAAAINISIPISSATWNRNIIGQGVATFIDVSATPDDHYGGNIKIESNGTETTIWDLGFGGTAAPEAVWFGTTTPVAVAAGDILTWHLTYSIDP